MHEISLVQGLFDELKKLARKHNSSKIISVTMEIGPRSGIVIDSFRFGFEILSADTDLLRAAKLIIEVPEITCTCSECGYKEVTGSSIPGQCPECGDLFLIPQGGEDLLLRQIEME